MMLRVLCLLVATLSGIAWANGFVLDGFLGLAITTIFTLAEKTNLEG